MKGLVSRSSTVTSAVIGDTDDYFGVSGQEKDNYEEWKT